MAVSSALLVARTAVGPYAACAASVPQRLRREPSGVFPPSRFQTAHHPACFVKAYTPMVEETKGRVGRGSRFPTPILRQTTPNAGRGEVMGSARDVGLLRGVIGGRDRTRR
ncbi:hypothetical protein BU26DRAFT_515675 [Trematosphaeria pertusa]|uniref:Uncharacterized protein n=1 Tax=Trematosphaeria pertusa TaxID=390896 RepID=A0A6A6IT66_9PLEO|nr:uncharacterized protein BU26DRAFT_515675 [Trematosphaeria pertusa]KAF2253308.1 hypothetical protein BU26DRAFT_515675 [Trematosphaeria pertusa]